MHRLLSSPSAPLAWRVLVVAIATPGILSSCSGGCSSLEPLPAPVPPDQTVEGGAQLRITPAGFDKLTAIIPGIINDSIGDGFCIGEVGFGAGIADVSACDTNACAGGAHGCPVNVTMQSVDMSVPDPQTFRIDVTFDVNVPVHVTADWIIGGDSTCTLDVTLNDGRVQADLGFGIDPATGELTIELTGINVFDISGLGINGCGVIGDILDAVVGVVADLISSSLGTFIIDALSPVIDGFIQDMLPDPLGIEGMFDLGGAVGSVSPGVNAKLEVRAVAGGYVSLPAQGLSLGLIVGLNADQDPSTRTPDLDNEPARCVPARPAPDFAQPPASLPLTSRNTFALQPAGEFLGQPDPAADLAIGLSETALDLAGHHIVSSGGMCLGVTSELAPQLNLGTIGILVPSLAELGETQKEPLLLVLRPTKPLDFTIGEGTPESPDLTIHIRDMDVDFYAFILERYVRGFTITLNIDAGLNLDFTLDENGDPAILPTLLGLDADSIQVDVSNTEFLNESAAQLEAIFPTVFNLVLPLLSDGLGPITLPDISGFSMENLEVSKVVTSEDDFLAIYATLAPGAGKMPMIIKSRPWSKAARDMHPVAPYTPVDTAAVVTRVTTPDPATIRAWYEKGDGALPEVELELGGWAPEGRRLEWQWNLNGGLWRPFSDDAHPVLRDKAFAVQGRHVINVRARSIGDYRTFDRTPVSLPIVIDSAPPWFVDELATVDGDDFVLPATDLVTADDAIEYSFAPIGDPERGTPWTRNGGRLGVRELVELAGEDGRIVVSARDELGNVSSTTLDTSTFVGFHGRTPAGGGCSCHAGSGPHSHGEPLAAVLGALFVALVAFRRRAGLLLLATLRRLRPIARWLPFVAIFLIGAFTPGCNCDPAPPGVVACMVDEDCADACLPGEIGICLDGTCQCLPDLPIGAMGQYSDLAIGGAGGAWVSAYNEEYGDLVVAFVTEDGRVPTSAYAFIDGVPNGPVVIEGSEVRGGIRAKGDDVGLYTSIAVGSDGEPMVSHYDRSNGSLRFAQKDGEFWNTMDVDKGEGDADPGENVGRWSSISVGPDGRPGIAYYALVNEGGGVQRTEVRFAQASKTHPTLVSDWNLFIVDSLAVPPPEDPTADPPPLPEGIGLFLTSARMANGAPVIAYYDRPNGDLKVVFFDQANNIWLDPVVADGADGSDVGWYPSIAVDASDVVHLTYVNAGNDDLLYTNLSVNTPEVIDDGYRQDGVTDDGLPLPVFHFVGDDSGLVVAGALTAVAYQDATSHELLFSIRNNNDGTWTWTSMAGADTETWGGGYGFYATADIDGDNVVLSSYVIDQQNYDYWVEIFRLPGVIE